MKILIVEDEIKIRNGISNFITRSTDHTIVGEAKNGVEGLEIYHASHPDLIMTDVRMPVMDGLEMVDNLRKEGADCRIIILSGYSEFEYAKKAMSMEVSEYLLKPLAPDDILNALDKVSGLVKKQIKVKDDSLKRAVEEIFYSTKAEDDARRGYIEEIKRQCGLQSDDVEILLGYGYNSNSAIRAEELLRFSEAVEQAPGKVKYCCPFDKRYEILCLLDEESINYVVKDLSYYFRKRRDSWIWAAGRTDITLCDSTCLDEIRKKFLYSDVISGEVIDDKKIAALKFENKKSSWNIEAEIKNAIYKDDKAEFERKTADFLKEVSEKNTDPMMIKEGIEVMSQKILHFLEDKHSEGADVIRRKKYLIRMESAYTIHELTGIYDELMKECSKLLYSSESVSNYAIKRAMTYIQNKYGENVSLEEIAENLGITPEYLSYLFNREMGVKFSTYLRNYRMEMAKQLLESTELKIYEIASMVGYSDTKYFNRVFKETEGLSPKEFRQK